MSNVPTELRYTKTHEWVKLDDDGNFVIGITDHAQALLGDLVFIDIPEVGAMFNTGDDCAVVESVKAASDVYAPIAGEIVASNEALADSPEIITNDAFGDGWIFKLKAEDDGEWEGLMDSTEYSELIAEEEA